MEKTEQGPLVGLSSSKRTVIKELLDQMVPPFLLRTVLTVAEIAVPFTFPPTGSKASLVILGFCDNSPPDRR